MVAPASARCRNRVVTAPKTAGKRPKTAVPVVPSVPIAPSVPVVPAAPIAPIAPSVPNVPIVPGVPGVPIAPGVPFGPNVLIAPGEVTKRHQQEAPPRRWQRRVLGQGHQAPQDQGLVLGPQVSPPRGRHAQGGHQGGGLGPRQQPPQGDLEGR
ncbi:PREDICTED: oleosin-B6-like [Tinamus guttatus]|uniref:oleosin-B6-like n=1 Tax=Tinamus guttatus TaxID=94827 RepID=UPI00052E9203|nr:PREDICTED: oleosin-B6-like [Tinamus guttatus]